ncbi:transcriptional regulator [Pseudomonas sp. EA_35y_Pfl2_R5]|uniref:transcriptional regulator n=1 Tax=Pseudomonas sp. EA_35y_Pfl2_R5 TaxID=3088690 RepID=UPI0030DB27FB
MKDAVLPAKILTIVWILIFFLRCAINQQDHEVSQMKVDIESPEQVGALIRASRKAMQIRQDDAAGIIGVSENFLGKVERGGESVQWGKLFQVMQELGMTVTIEVPEAFADDTRKVLIETVNKKLAKQSKAAASKSTASGSKAE